MSRVAFQRVARFDEDDMSRAVERLERNVGDKFDANDRSPAARLFDMSQNVVTSNYAARFGEFVKVDPTSGPLTVLLPRPDDPRADSIRIANIGTSTNTITVQPAFSDCFVNSTTSFSMTAGKQSVELYPDRFARNWIIAGDGQASPIVSVSASVAYPTAAGSASVTVFTVPVSPTGADRFILEEFDVRTSAIAGGDTGTVAHTVGLTAGGSQFMTSQSVNNATAAGLIGGLQLPTLGASHTAAQGYEARMDAGQAIVLQVTTAGGTVSAGKSATIYLKGRLLQ